MNRIDSLVRNKVSSLSSKMSDSLRVSGVITTQIQKFYDLVEALLILGANKLEMSHAYARLLVDLRRIFWNLKFSLLKKQKR
jgi:hypothetical protein